MYSFKKYDQNQESIAKRIEAARQINPDQAEELKALKIILNCIDLTTLEGSDTEEKVLGLCNKAKSIHTLGADFPDVAAVCFYPTFAALAKKNLKDTNIEVACVAGAFPAGQSPIEIKVAEVEFAVVQGADEIDMVISRGKFLEGKFTEVADEIKAIKKACGDAHLKVILETGELKTVDNIRKASEIAINAGADFIKTSTGKEKVNATLPVSLVMVRMIREYFDRTGFKIGYKPAGGISTAKESLLCLILMKEELGRDWLEPELFRFGASSLLGDIERQL